MFVTEIFLFQVELFFFHTLICSFKKLLRIFIISLQVGDTFTLQLFMAVYCFSTFSILFLQVVKLHARCCRCLFHLIKYQTEKKTSEGQSLSKLQNTLVAFHGTKISPDVGVYLDSSGGFQPRLDRTLGVQ